MPLTYHDVTTTQLHMLADAAKAWKKMGNRFGELEKNFEDHVLKATGDGSWRGEGFQAATSASGVIKHEYGAAKAEALAIAKILNEAQTQFAGFKKSIERIVKEAEGKNYRVNVHTGEVTYDWGSLTPEEIRTIKNDPENLRVIKKAERGFTSSIKKLVKEADDADHGVKLALTAAVTDTDGKGSLNGFNSAAEGDMEKVEAKRASELATKLDSEGKLPPREIAEMRRLARDNSHDTAFSRTLLNSLGPQGTVEFTNNLNMAARDSDSGNKSGYLAIEKGLANSLGTATKDTDSTFYKKWREEMKKVGVQRFDDALPSAVGQKSSQPRGYQSMLTLMEQGDPKSFSSEMLQDLGQDIRAAEDPDKGGDSDIWDLPGTHSGKSDGWFANDPMDSTLGIMSHQPGTATEFLDPGPDKENDMLRYLIKERDWEISEETTWTGNVSHTKGIEDGDSRMGLGRAMEAAATGQQPLGPDDPPRPNATHTSPQARVMESAINLTDPGVGGDGIHKNVQRPLANALADYAPDTHESLDRVSDEGTNPGVRGSADDARMFAEPGALRRVMRGVSDDPDAYTLLHQAEREQIKQEIASLPSDAKPNSLVVEDTMGHAAKSMGVFDAIKQDITTDIRDDKQAEADWNAKVVYHIVGGALTPIPGAGDAVQRGIDTWTWNMSNDQKESATTEANAKIAERYLESESQTRHFVGDWGERAGYARDSPQINVLQEAAMQARHDVRDETSSQLGNGDY